MSQQNSKRLWSILSLVVIAIFFFMFMGSPPNRSRNSDYWEDDIPAENNVPRAPGLSDILLFVATGAAVLVTFHPSYGGLNIKHRWYYQGVLLMLFYFSAIVISEIVGGSRNIPLLIVLVPFIWIIYLIAIPVLIRAKQYRLVHGILNVMQTLAPKNANLYLTRATLYDRQVNVEKTLGALNRAIELTPRFKKKGEGWFAFDDWRLIIGHNMRMNVYFAIAQQDMAMDDAEILVRINPTSPVHYINRSLALRQRRDYEAAQADLDYANQLKLEPLSRAFLLYSRGHLATLQHQYTEARDFYETALDASLSEPEQKNFHPEVYKELGLLELREGREAEAEKAFQAGHLINPEYPVVGMALLHAHRGQWDQAVTEWKRLVKLQPHFRDFDIMRRHHEAEPSFVAFIDQIAARFDNTPEAPVLLPSHPLSAS